MVPLANLIVKETLTEEDVLTCQKTVYNLVDMERKNDPLPISTVGSRGKGPKRYLFSLSIVWLDAAVTNGPALPSFPGMSSIE